MLSARRRASSHPEGTPGDLAAFLEEMEKLSDL